jgi:hypothetical protein
VLETQYIMRIVFVIGSEGISLTLGYFIIGFILIITKVDTMIIIDSFK